MNAVKPMDPPAGARHVVYAKDQPEYLPLPACVGEDGMVLTEWELTAEELGRMMRGGRVRLWVATFGQPLQPVKVEVSEPPPEQG